MRCGGSSRGGGSGRIWWHLARGGQTVDIRFGWVWLDFGDLRQKTIFCCFPLSGLVVVVGGEVGVAAVCVLC